ncbi:phosphoethanolamine transferase [Roseateles violae]|uniref:Phosphoethanolamine--lipid A transferase n=1 Tax=Roseateles violae TaxID=3058042 RepID=A0ABT8DZT7_9BURK|nr:phosphoethanolamine--lipid A transferase [Pelomonas sp. PFR6]MDN3923068.1 phosphoethanolamine--lipid A transferase [Pelomonas sp. PFR6]
MRLLAPFKPSLASPLTLAWLAAVWIGVLGNWPLWQRMIALPELDNARGHVFVLVFIGIVIALQGALLSLLAWRRLIKPVLVLMLIATAALAHFIGSYGTVIDPTMVVNIVQTDVREARDLLSLRLALSLLLIALPPIVWLWRRPLADAPFGRRLGFNLLGFLGGILLMVALGLSCFADLAATMRNYKSLRYMISPVNAFYSLGAVAARAGAQPKGPPEVIGADARLAPRPAGAKPPLLLLVVGETARAANFSLDGYERPTNAELAKLPVLSFKNVTSCGTSTAASLPCMFSPLGREQYGEQKKPQQNLLDVLQRAGLAVLWLDNQSGCKGVCERVPNSMTTQLPAGAKPLPAGLCDGEECLDEALLHGLDERLAALDPARTTQGVVLVLHQMGSHGPAYYKRSPAARKPFQPECTSNALQQCPREQVVNAYDNTIAYTDHVLAGAVRWLQGQQQRFDASLFYVSDHGESLGENNLYLHGVPYAFAPREQTHVPLILWMSEGAAAGDVVGKGPQAQCMAQRLDQPYSHDHLFHTVLGMAGVQTSVYRPAMDMIAPCRAR